MAEHLSMRSGNPVLSEGTFQRERALPGTESITIAGTVNKSALLLGILLITATFTWNQGADAATGFILVGALGGLIVPGRR